ncbi:hypothetical protein PYR74_15290 [Acinetobacter bereziniae]|uniref:hypothetical protein n=2 Tax=Acinetobacter TaxID=469 RepID=UPI0005744F95|nr:MULTISPECIES: hypothetical protein [Acinetobacter]KKW81272.1 hypothetical protein AAV97_02490 [Acinetobacter sp. Ag2]MBJ9371810.1 hypothetical protein [Acinetobacter sp. TGL-Y2]MBO3655841.1 hypothetical protein [Acinetobacter bereziniae]MCM8512663.1 hypothetical protein [Acinetobacter bereziniae]MDV8155710.1 hypothetical protein [Acinetobacter bereziniae]
MVNPKEPQQQDEMKQLLESFLANVFAITIIGVIGLFLYGFVQFLASFEPKTRLKYADVTVEERLRNSPKIFDYFYRQSKLIFAEKLPLIKYDDFLWVYQKSTYKRYHFEISSLDLSQQQFEDIFIAKFNHAGWELIQTDRDRPYQLDQVDYTFVDQLGNRAFVTKPMHNQKNLNFWKISMVENSGVYTYKQ